MQRLLLWMLSSPLRLHPGCGENWLAFELLLKTRAGLASIGTLLFGFVPVMLS
jgi:hypothetical protein